MQRILLFCNAVLALLLAIQVAKGPALVQAAERNGGSLVRGSQAGGAVLPPWTAADLRLLPLPAVGGHPLRQPGLPKGYLLQLGASAGPEVLPADPVEIGLVAEPPLALAVYWAADDLLRVIPLDTPAPATNYLLRFARPLVAKDGRTLPAGSSVAWATPGARLVSVQVEDLPGSGPAELGLRLWFDHAIEAAALAKHLQVVAFESRQPLPMQVVPLDDAQQGFRLLPQTAELPAEVELRIAPGLLTRGGSLPSLDEQRRQVKLREPLQWRGIRATAQGVVLQFNRSIPAPDLQHLRLQPPVDYTVEQAADGLLLRGEFAPGSLCTVDLAPGFPGGGRHSLQQALRRSVVMPDRAPLLGFVGSGSVLSAAAEPQLRIRGINQENVRLRLQRLYANNAVRMLQDREAPAFAPPVSLPIPVAAARNVEWTETVDLRGLLGDAPAGFYRVELLGDASHYPVRQLLQITDLGVTLRAGRDSAAVQVLAISSGLPVAAARLQLLSPTNQTLATATTDAQGIAMLSWDGAPSDAQPFAVVVEHQQDRAIVGLQRDGTNLADPGLGGRPYLQTGHEAYLWLSRGIVRPGETLQGAALLRDAAAAAAPVASSLVVAMPGGKIWQRRRLQPDGAGLAAFAIELPGDAPMGRWWLRAEDRDGVVLGQVGFEVAAFVPNRLEAEVAIDGEPVLGESLVAQVTARWLDGTPAQRQPVLVRLRLLPGEFRPATAAGYSFRGEPQAVPPGELPPQPAVLDAAGKATVHFPLPLQLAEQAYRVVLSAEVEDPSGRVVRAATERLQVRAPQALGVRFQPSSIDVVMVTPAGELLPAADDRVALRIERRRWVQHYVEDSPQRWRWRSVVATEVLHQEQLALAAGRGSWDLRELAVAMPESGRSGGSWLVAVAATADRVVEQTLGKPPLAPDRLRVTAQNEPAPGEQAWLAVEAPCAGRGFVTLESDRVHAAFAVALQSGHNRIAVPVPADLKLPNLHAVVTLTRPAEASAVSAVSAVSAAPAAIPGAPVAAQLQAPPWLLGGAKLPLRRDELAMPVELTVPASVLPTAPLPLAISAPGATSVVVAVVDEGVLALTGHADPDPHSWLLATRALQVRGADLHAQLQQQMKFAPRAKTGGGGDEDAMALLRGGSVDPQIRPLALWAELPVVDGRATTSLALPAYEGRVRVLVLAAGPQRFGATASSVVVRAELSLQAAAPRVLLPGDHCLLPISLRQDLLPQGTIELQVEAPTGIALPAGALHQLRLLAGEPQTLELPVAVSADAEGPQTLRLLARCGAASRELSLVLAVRPPRLPTQSHEVLALAAAGQQTLAEGWQHSGLQVELTYGLAKAQQLRPALQALLDYPYGCCEQTISRGMALLAAAALWPQLHAAGEQPPQLLPLLQTAVDRVLAMQTSRGSFGWWLGAVDEDPQLTTYAVEFLRAAHEHGIDVDAAALARGLDRLQYFASSSADLALRSHAIEVLLRAGRPLRAQLDWLLQQPLPSQARPRLAVALALLGEPAAAAAQLAVAGGDALPHGRDDAALTRRSPFVSPICAEALRLRARLLLAPGDETLPAQVANLQQRLLRPQQLSTQELAQGFLAVADFYRQQPVPAAGTALRLQLDGETVELVPGARLQRAIQPGCKLVWPPATGHLLVSLRGMAPAAPQSDSRLQLRRELIDLASGLPVQQLQRGRVYELRIHGEAQQAFDDLAIVDLLPGCLEAEPPPPGGLPAVPADRPGPALLAATREARDDRVLLFPAAVGAKQFWLRHRVRATLPGEYSMPALQAEAMYDPSLRVVVDDQVRLVVRP